ALDCSDQIVVVTTLSLPVIRRTKRLLGTLVAAHYPAGKVVVVVNRYVNEQKELLRQTEDMLGVRVAGLIPNDYETAREAVEHGKPLAIMAARTPIGQWYLGGADLLMAEKVSGNGTAVGKGQSKAARFFGRCLSTLKLEPRGKPSVV
ncbi:MAG TPA: hypothetical protein VFB56_07150, partial [Nitrospiraceae bacterium]|nr:hypothetical protein [Nitrospiraceae bacterium]